MAAISKIKIDGFKAFPKEFELILEGKNLLMYGENGSGKSSIYYALHILLQSQYHDKGSIYFNKNNPESLVNKYTITENPYVEIMLEGSDTKYHLSKNGYEELPAEAISPLRDMNAECVFINHKFLFNSFSFRNSQYIDLFPVFIKDILPFTFTDDRAKYMSELYDEVVAGIQRKGRGRRIDPEYDRLIEKFNQEVLRIIEKINHKDDINAPSLVSNIYNNHFRDSNDRELSIELKYEDNKNKIPQANKSYWLRYGYRYQQTTIAHNIIEERISCKLEILPPAIRVTIKEKKEDGTWDDIEKPHSRLNEAKLTAIILSIRFSLLDLVAAPDGRFLVLDDMLISLDMSNRAKVVDFLLRISDKYKIYLFTHDRAFFEHFKERIYFANRSKGIAKENGWLFKELYKDDTSTNNPKEFNSESDIARACKHYKEFDYPAAANYLRKAVEAMVNEVFPPKLSKQNDGAKHERLRNVLEISFEFFSKIEEFDLADLSRLIANLNLLMNPLSHKSTETNVYKIELKEIFAIIERLSLQVQELSIEEVLPRKEKVYLYLKEDEHITQKYEIELQQELYKYIIAGTTKVWQPEAKSTRSCTITDGVEGAYNKNERYKGSLEKICQDIHSHKRKDYADNYLEMYKDKNNNVLNSII